MNSNSTSYHKLHLILWLSLAFLALMPCINSPLALLLGVVLGVTLGNPNLPLSKKLAQKLLMWSVIGLGAGMDLRVVGRVGVHGIFYTMAGISFTLLLGEVLRRWLKVAPAISTLISVGTAICGGSAIAAVAPVIRAKDNDITVSLATVFLLNASALLLFPWIGHHFELSQRAFGLWSALAIHDTSSVVGASLQYGPEALQIGTTVKLARALWIVPVTLFFAWRENQKVQIAGEASTKIKVPWFIGGFLLMAALVTFIPSLNEAGHLLSVCAKRGLVLTLFLIGSNLTRQSLKAVGVKPLLQGVLLWVVVASASLAAVFYEWISV